MSYTAQEGDREAGEGRVLDVFEEYSQDNGLFKVISLKYEFLNEFHKLVSTEDQTIEFELTSDYFPYFLIDKQLLMDKKTAYFKPKRRMAVSVPAAMKINDVNVIPNIAKDISIAGTASEIDKIKAGTVSLRGSLIQKCRIDSGYNGIDKVKMEDILILIRYKIT